jgi:hypothetical protein
MMYAHTDEIQRLFPPPHAAQRSLGLSGSDEANLLDMVKESYNTLKSVKPLVSFLGEHPIVTLSILMLAILGGAALGAYIGAGFRQEMEEESP